MSEESSRAWKDQYMLRLPDGMRDRIKAAAEANNRSMNAEIVAVLEREYPVPEHGDFARTMLLYMQAYREAETDEDKAATLARFRSKIEAENPGMTIRLWFGMPTPMTEEEAERLDARGPSFVSRIARRFLSTGTPSPD